MTVVMFDTVDVSTVPSNPQAVAGYTSGNWPTFEPLVQRFPNAHHLSIAVNSSHDADCLDVEAGDATPDEAPAWVHRQQARGIAKPVLYASVSNMGHILFLLAQAGIPRGDVRLWTAHYTFREHLCSSACGFGFFTTADATQWTDRALGRNLDQSLCADSFFGPPPPPPDPHHYGWFTGVYRGSPWGHLDERAIVEHYDGARAHWVKYRLFLGKLRDECSWLAGRIQTVAEEQNNWDAYHRRWRHDQLVRRAHGDRLA